MSKRLEFIDIAKGFAIICVVIGHVLYYDLYNAHNMAASELFMFIYSFHMPLFVFLSGLVAKNDLEWNDMPRDLCKRFRSLVVPFLVVGGIFSLWKEGNLDFVFSELKYGYWYLWVLFILYALCYPISKIGAGKFNAICQCLAAGVVFGTLIALTKIIPEKIQDTLSLLQVRIYFPYFFVAKLIRQNNLLNIVANNTITFISVFVILLAIYVINIDFAGSGQIIALFMIVLVLNVCKKIENVHQYWNVRIKDSLAYLGRNSLYIYIFHFFFIELFVTTYFKNALPTYSNVGWDLLLSTLPTVMVIAGSLILKSIIGREPIIMKYIFNKQ